VEVEPRAEVLHLEAEAYVGDERGVRRQRDPIGDPSAEHERVLGKGLHRECGELRSPVLLVFAIAQQPFEIDRLGVLLHEHPLALRGEGAGLEREPARRRALDHQRCERVLARESLAGDREQPLLHGR